MFPGPRRSSSTDSMASTGTTSWKTFAWSSRTSAKEWLATANPIRATCRTRPTEARYEARASGDAAAGGAECLRRVGRKTSRRRDRRSRGGRRSEGVSPPRQRRSEEGRCLDRGDEKTSREEQGLADSSRRSAPAGRTLRGEKPAALLPGDGRAREQVGRRGNHRARCEVFQRAGDRAVQ